MERIDLDSTALAWVRYLSEQRVLQVGLRTGRDYDYLDVPARVYQELLAAKSKGRYYNLQFAMNSRFATSAVSMPD